jgi:hypothetical protein
MPLVQVDERLKRVGLTGRDPPGEELDVLVFSLRGAGITAGTAGGILAWVRRGVAASS